MFTAEIESFEGQAATKASNGTFELVYWRFGLALAATWRSRLGLPPSSRWSKAQTGLCSPVPHRLNGTDEFVYYPYSDYSKAFAPGYAVQLFAAALLPGSQHGLDDNVMRTTIVQAVHNHLNITKLPWCSDPPLYAMAAARLGLRDLAVELLLQPNTTSGGTMSYLKSGHCQIHGFLPVYLPGNGALLAAVAMLAGGGWDNDNGRVAPGLPADGWSVKAEGFHKMF